MRSATTWGLVSLALLIGLGVYLAPLQPNLVALQLTFTPAAFAAVLAAWQPQGVALFRSHLPVDGLLLLSYAMFGYLLVGNSTVFARFSGAARWKLALVLPLAACADAAENLLHWWLTAPDASAAAWIYTLAGVCASLKWLCLLAFAAVVVWAWLQRRSA
ncbi:MAG: hypothetical protein KGN32_02800 [Burkholderiales bacterium]|nr:hypothetical protein [Burkholderiales bacterium]